MTARIRSSVKRRTSVLGRLWALLPRTLQEVAHFYSHLDAEALAKAFAGPPPVHVYNGPPPNLNALPPGAIVDAGSPSAFFFMDPDGADPNAEPLPGIRDEGTVRVLPVQGVLMDRLDFLSAILGEVSFTQVTDAVNAARTSADVAAVVLDFDSPGGMAVGPGAVAEAVRELAQAKPTVAVNSGLMTSAAQWIGAAAGEVVQSRDGLMGSIGVRALLVDPTEFYEREGVRRVELVSSDSPAKRMTPVDEEVLGNVQSEIDAMADVFIADVARFRGVSRETVVQDFGRGGVLVGEAAVDAGLADRVGTVAAEVSRLQGL